MADFKLNVNKITEPNIVSEQPEGDKDKQTGEQIARAAVKDYIRAEIVRLQALLGTI